MLFFLRLFFIVLCGFFFSFSFVDDVICAEVNRTDSLTVVMTEDVQLMLGDSFFRDGEYYRAVTEYQKFTYLFPTSEQSAYALTQIGLAYYHGKEFRRAIDYFARARSFFKQDTFSKAAFYEGVCYEKLGLFKEAQDAFEKSFYFDQESVYAMQATVGQLMLDVEHGHIDVARHRLSDLELRCLDSTALNFSEFDSVDNCLERFAEQPTKSPLLAGTLSAIIPGSGYCYAGRKKDGLVAFVVNGLFIAGTVVAINDENYPAAALIGGAGVPFYLGNIYGSANAAQKWNLSLRKGLQKELSLMMQYHY